MRERGYGRVVFVSSVAAFTGGLVGPHYAASKAGLLGLGSLRCNSERDRTSAHRRRRSLAWRLGGSAPARRTGSGQAARSSRGSCGRSAFPRYQPVRYLSVHLCGRRHLPSVRRQCRLGIPSSLAHLIESTLCHLGTVPKVGVSKHGPEGLRVQSAARISAASARTRARRPRAGRAPRAPGSARRARTRTSGRRRKRARRTAAP